MALAGELKAGLKSEFDPVQCAAGPETQNRSYAAYPAIQKGAKIYRNRTSHVWAPAIVLTGLGHA
jgi:hypothetical protein